MIDRNGRTECDAVGKLAGCLAGDRVSVPAGTLHALGPDLLTIQGGGNDFLRASVDIDEDKIRVTLDHKAVEARRQLMEAQG